MKCPEISIYILLLLLFSFLSYCIVSLLHFSSDICDLSNSLFSHYLSCCLYIFSIVITFTDTLSHYISLSLSPSTPPSVSFISFLSLSPVPFLFLPLYHPLLSVSLCLFSFLCLCLYLINTVGGNNGKGEGWRGSSVNNSSNDLTTINQSSVSGVALTARTAIDRVLRYDKSVFLSVHSAIKKAGEQTQALDILK